MPLSHHDNTVRTAFDEALPLIRHAVRWFVHGPGLETLHRVRRELERLPQEERVAIEGYYLQGRVGGEIARATGQTVTAVRQLLTQGRARLRRRVPSSTTTLPLMRAIERWFNHGPELMPGPLAGRLLSQGLAPNGRGLEILLAIKAAWQQLPASQRVVMEEYYLGGRSVKEITTRQGTSARTVQRRLHEGRTTLAALWQQQRTHEKRKE